jgi:hypothetical protein
VASPCSGRLSTAPRTASTLSQHHTAQPLDPGLTLSTRDLKPRALHGELGQGLLLRDVVSAQPDMSWLYLTSYPGTQH